MGRKGLEALKMGDARVPAGRRKARVLALQALYETDAVSHPLALVLERLFEKARLPQESRDFVQRLVSEVRDRIPEIDSIIQKHAPAWPVSQLAIIDRNILRLAIYEIMFDNRTPPKVAINEAVELAKLFGTESSPRFVNGVLGSVMSSMSKNKEA